MKRHWKVCRAAAVGFLVCAMLPGIWLWYQRKAGMAFVRQLGAGINIGNSLDVYKLKMRNPSAAVEEYEVYWGNPPIDGKLFVEIHSAGFDMVRIPVSWGEHMDASGNVEKEWMERVTEVVDAALDAGLFVILDTHHEKWLVPVKESEKKVTDILCTLWRQIAENFADRGEKLLFEAMNEPRVEGGEEWTSGTTEYREVVNRLNKAFVDTVRDCGGYNRKRWLLLPAYGSTRRETALKEMKLPWNFRLIVSVHAYIPYEFTLGETQYDSWDAAQEEDTKEIDGMMERLDQLFLRKGIPVVITEFGCDYKENPEDILAWAEYYTGFAKKKGIPYIWWDNGAESSLLDREDYTWNRPELAGILTKNSVNGK